MRRAILPRQSRVTKGSWLLVLASLFAACTPYAGASATLLLEEPYGKMGLFTATGHAAVYLSGVCAQSPTALRACAPGEAGVVLSRYDGVGGYDWVAIPLIPYLYAVDQLEDVPLFADSRMVFSLRDHYRRKYLQDVAPNTHDGEAPGGNWYELVGSSYDRAIYGFEIETTSAQDNALIEKYNSAPNRSHFHLVSNNCADFAKDLFNFYYPHALRRSIVADVGMTTPKQMAKQLIKFSTKHRELESSSIVFPQVPSTMPRSTAVHGVVESFLKSKKYIVPSAIVNPVFAGCVLATYVATEAGRFNPTRNASIFNADGVPEEALSRREGRAYQKELESLLAEIHPDSSVHHVEKTWAKLQSRAKSGVDDQGEPVLQMEFRGEEVTVGATAANVLSSDAPSDLVQQFLEARMQMEMRKAQNLTRSDLLRDWKLLQKSRQENDSSQHLSLRSLTAPPDPSTLNSGTVTNVSLFH